MTTGGTSYLTLVAYDASPISGNNLAPSKLLRSNVSTGDSRSLDTIPDLRSHRKHCLDAVCIRTAASCSVLQQLCSRTGKGSISSTSSPTSPEHSTVGAIQGNCQALFMMHICISSHVTANRLSFRRLRHTDPAEVPSAPARTSVAGSFGFTEVPVGLGMQLPQAPHFGTL